jgi:hypothetical protein
MWQPPLKGKANKVKAMPATSPGCCHGSICKIGYLGAFAESVPATGSA